MSKKKKKQPEYHQYIYCTKCGKGLCRAIDLPHLGANYCSNCGNKITEGKSKLMGELNRRKVF